METDRMTHAHLPALTRRHLLQLAAAGGAGALAPSLAKAAQVMPSNAIRFVVPFAPGSFTD
ncbi:MAG: twin-arginine translocation signal domain-containing protein, partial [Rubrivivax sp.]